MTPPCKKNGVDCRNRTVGCQSRCEAYAEYAKAKRAERIQLNKEASAMTALWNYGRRSYL